jgi:quercetin dioxygenase-like cupin family protein
MREWNRREICAGIATVALAGVKMTEAETTVTAENALAKARVFHYGDEPKSLMPNGTDRRVLARGTLESGESVRVHESVAPGGVPPNPLHVIQHSEIIVVVQGTLALLHDGKEEKAEQGDVIYVAFGTNHTVRNVGDGPARYVVVAIGGDVKNG